MSEPTDFPVKTGPQVPSFLVTYCRTCDRDVLATADIDDAGDVVRRCIHCDGPMDADAASARWVDSATLVKMGYFIDGFEPEEDGCGTGCRDGACGVQQPSQTGH